jgi:S1-C subfamily serine protease
LIEFKQYHYKQKTLLFLFSLFFLTKTSSYCQSINLNAKSIGFIVLDDTIYSGTGLAFLKPNYILTCAHVIDSTKKIAFVNVVNEKQQFKLRIIKYDLDNDLALLESDEIICDEPLKPFPLFDIQPSQHIFYCGYDILASADKVKRIQFNSAYVNAIGKVQSGKMIVNFIEFVGVGIPGYSGGPVFNDKGEVIAIMREAWYKQGTKGGQVQLINRAFSIGPILK